MLLLGARGFANIHQQKWSVCPKKTFPIIVVLIVILVPYIASTWNPYEVLGIRKDAQPDQIKRAYRELARRYHPDKTTSRDSGQKFIEINKAFDILKDPVKKARYDQHGTVDETRHSRGYHHGANMYEHRNQGRMRESWFGQDGQRPFAFYTTYGGPPDSNFAKKSINTRQYINTYISKSKQKPYLVFFYTDFCPSCSMIESLWVKITNELSKFNVGMFTINVHMENRLAVELGIRSVPQFACLLNGQLHHYDQTEVSLASFVKFIKSLLPSNLIPLLRSEDAQDRHISNTFGSGNRLAAIILNDEKNLKLRYLLLAYSLRQYYQFAHISTKLSEYQSFASHYNLTIDSKSHIIVFDEKTDSPKTHIHYEPEKFFTEVFTRDLSAWPFLRLPRLSSQQMFDDLCIYSIPKYDDQVVPKLCVILFASSSPGSMPARRKLIEFIEHNNLVHDREVIFTYLDPSKQPEFVESILLETASNRPKFLSDDVEYGLMLLSRQVNSNRRAHHTWVKARWDPSNVKEFDRAKLELLQHVQGYKRGSFRPIQKLLLNILVDEEGPSLMERIYSRFVSSISRAFYYILKRESVSTVVILMGCALITSLFLYKSPVPTQYNTSERNFRHYFSGEQDFTSQEKNGTTNVTQSSHLNSDMKILELKAETYNGMLRLLKPGCRTIVLLTDRETKEKLLETFRKAVWPYRKNRTLLFGFLCLDKNLAWYRQLLEQVLGCEGLNVNKKNCIGTVLSLNGFKKYFRVYHAMHHEIDFYDDETDNDGTFLGFNEEDEDPELGITSSKGRNKSTVENVIYTVDNLLDKLPIWLDKMFDGLTKRYFVDNWPEDIE